MKRSRIFEGGFREHSRFTNIQIHVSSSTIFIFQCMTHHLKAYNLLLQSVIKGEMTLVDIGPFSPEHVTYYPLPVIGYTARLVFLKVVKLGINYINM